jgi:hypothetical protein
MPREAGRQLRPSSAAPIELRTREVTSCRKTSSRSRQTTNRSHKTPATAPNRQDRRAITPPPQVRAPRKSNHTLLKTAVGISTPLHRRMQTRLRARQARSKARCHPRLMIFPIHPLLARFRDKLMLEHAATNSIREASSICFAPRDNRTLRSDGCISLCPCA